MVSLASVSRPASELDVHNETKSSHSHMHVVLVSSLPRKWPLVLPVCYGYYVGDVHSLVHAGNMLAKAGARMHR